MVLSYRGPSWLVHSLRIAREEHIRRRRRLNHSTTYWIFASIVILTGTVLLTGIAYVVGTELRDGTFVLPLSTVRAICITFWLGMVWYFETEGFLLPDRDSLDILLTSVPAGEIALGLLLTAYTRVCAILVFPIFGVSFGFAVGVRSPMSAIAILIVVGGGVALALLVGFIIGCMAKIIVATVPFIERHRTAVFVLVILFPGFVFLVGHMVGNSLFLQWIYANLDMIPISWFVDSILIGIPTVQVSFLRSLGTFALFVIGIPLLTVIAIRLAEYFWYTDPVQSGTRQHSASLIGGSISSQLFGGVVSRPALTVAKKNWLHERRAPFNVIGGLSYLFFIFLLIFMMYAMTGMVPAVASLFSAIGCAWAIGITYGLNLLGNEYPVLPATLISIPGREFIQGTIISGVIIGFPITVALTFFIGIVSPLYPLAALAVALLSGLLCICGATLAAAAGMKADTDQLRKIPISPGIPSVYSSVGRRAFLRFGVVLMVLSLVASPGLIVLINPITNTLATILAISTAIIKFSGFLLSAILICVVSVVSYREAIQSFDQYTLY